MRLQTVHDLVYPHAVSGEINALGVIYSNTPASQKDQFVQHQKVVLLNQADRAEIQRCSSQKIPVILQTHSLQSSFDVFKMNGVKMVLVILKGAIPIIDYGWMSKAFEERKSVIFSLPELQKAFTQKDSGGLQEYRKLAQLLQKSKMIKKQIKSI